MKSSKKGSAKPPAPRPPAKSKGKTAAPRKLPVTDSTGGDSSPQPPSSPRKLNPRGSIDVPARRPSVLKAAPPQRPPPKKRPNTTSRQKPSTPQAALTGDKAASEALKLLHNRLFGAIEESEGKARQDVQNATKDGYAKLLGKFGKGWSKAKKAEEETKVARELQRLKDELDAQETERRLVMETDESTRMIAFEKGYREETHKRSQMDIRNRAHAAEREEVERSEYAARVEIESNEQAVQATLGEDFRSQSIDATRRQDIRVEALRERRRLKQEKLEGERRDALEQERCEIMDDEATSRADVDITETYAFELVQERWAKVQSADTRRRKLVDNLQQVEADESMGRESVTIAYQNGWDAFGDLAAEDRLQRDRDGVARHKEEVVAMEKVEQKASSKLIKDEGSERALLAAQLQQGIATHVAWVRKRRDQLAAIVSTEEAERRASLKEEYLEYQQLGVDCETHYQTVLKILQAQREADDKSLAEYLADAQNMELQLEMLANKRRERTEQLKKEREVVIEAVAALEKGELELMLEKWVHSLEDLYLAIDAKNNANEPADDEVQAYISEKLMFAMQLSQHKRSHPTHAKVSPASRGRMTARIRSFLELLVRDGDTNRTNMTLMNTLLSDNLPIDFGSIIQEDNLLNDAAVDGSVSFVDAFLSRTDLKLSAEAAASLITLGLNNPSKQVLFAECFLRREFALHMLALRDDLSTIWQEFFFRCVTSGQDDSQGSSQRNFVVQTMLSRMNSSVGIRLSIPSTGEGPLQGHTPITALCRAGNVDLFQMLLLRCDPQLVAESLVAPCESDQTTPLINSILANNEVSVRLLLQFANVRDQIRAHRSHRGTAEDVVEKVLETDESIVEIVLQCGAGGAAPEVPSLSMSTLGQLAAVQGMALSTSAHLNANHVVVPAGVSPTADFFESPTVNSLGRLSLESSGLLEMDDL